MGMNRFYMMFGLMENEEKKERKGKVFYVCLVKWKKRGKKKESWGWLLSCLYFQ